MLPEGPCTYSIKDMLAAGKLAQKVVANYGMTDLGITMWAPRDGPIEFGKRSFEVAPRFGRPVDHPGFAFVACVSCPGQPRLVLRVPFLGCHKGAYCFLSRTHALPNHTLFLSIELYPFGDDDDADPHELNTRCPQVAAGGASVRFILPPSTCLFPVADAVQVTVDNIDADLFGTGIRGGMFQPADQTLHRVRTATHDLVRAAFADSLARGRPHPASLFHH